MKISVLTAIFLTASILNAQTVINAVTDAASYSPRVSPGALATIFGSHLASGTGQASSFPLPLSLGGASVYAVQSSQSPIQAPLVYASATQINFQVPSGLAAGTANFYVTVGGGNSSSFTVNVVSAGPSIFQDTSNHAIAQDAGAGYATNSAAHPAASGSVVVVYLTGLGPVDHSVADGAASPDSLSNATGTTSATIGGVNAPVQFLGLTPGYAGLAQANILVPNLATGKYPLVITVGGYVSSSAALSVAGSGTAPPTFLSLLGQVNFANSSVSSVAINGNTTYVCGANRIYIIDTSNVSTPGLLGEFGDADLAGNGGPCVLNQTVGPILVDIVGPGGSPTFVVYNVATPTQPIKLGQIAPQSYTSLVDLSFIGTAGFASTSWYQFDSASNITAQHGDLLAFDLSAELPQLISAMVPSPAVPASNNLNLRPNALALPPSSNYLNTVYSASTTATGNSTAGNAALDVIDVSNLQNMQGVERVTVSSAAIFLGFAYDNNLLFLTGNTTGLRNPGVPDFSITGNLTLTTMNISNVRNPVPITTVVTGIQTTGTYHMAPFGSSVFAIVNNPPASDLSGPGSLMIVDARNTSTPVLYPFMTQFGLSGLVAINNFLLVPNQNGMNIYQIQVP